MCVCVHECCGVRVPFQPQTQLGFHIQPTLTTRWATTDTTTQTTLNQIYNTGATNKVPTAFLHRLTPRFGSRTHRHSPRTLASRSMAPSSATVAVTRAVTRAVARATALSSRPGVHEQQAVQLGLTLSVQLTAFARRGRTLQQRVRCRRQYIGCRPDHLHALGGRLTQGRRQVRHRQRLDVPVCHGCQVVLDPLMWRGGPHHHAAETATELLAKRRQRHSRQWPLVYGAALMQHPHAGVSG